MNAKVQYGAHKIGTCPYCEAYEVNPYNHTLFLFHCDIIFPFIPRVSKSSLPVTMSEKHFLCKIWGFHCGDYEERGLLGCYAVWLLWGPTFRRRSVATKRRFLQEPQDVTSQKTPFNISYIFRAFYMPNITSAFYICFPQNIAAEIHTLKMFFGNAVFSSPFTFVRLRSKHSATRHY
jgi:hypothetical protein